MSLTEHTPGPWRVVGTCTVSAAGEKFHRIADCMEPADAKLIAAAPGMLDALISVRATIALYDCSIYIKAELAVIDAAINAAMTPAAVAA
jgi:hypothetical protein